MARLTLTRIVKELYALLLTAVFLVVFPSLIIALLPIYAFRAGVRVLARLFRPDLGRMIASRSSVLAVDDPYSSPKWNLCVWLIFEKNLVWENFQASFLRNIVDRKIEKTGEFAEPEYQQFYTTWFGFLFWAWDRQFNIKNHIKYYWQEQDPLGYRERETTEEEFRQIVKQMTWAPFPAGRSPWQFLYIPNYKDAKSSAADKSVMVFRLHHGLCDGFKILRILMIETNNVNMDLVAKPRYVSRPWWVRRLVIPMVFAVRAPFDMMRLLVQSSDQNEWHQLPEREMKKPMSVGFSPIIPVDRIKEVRRQHGVSFSAVLLSCIAAGVRKMMQEKGVRVPENISTALAVPIPGHPNKLRNHFIFSFIKLPVGVRDAKERLLKMERNMTELKQSTAWMLSFALVPLVGSLFSSMMSCFNYNWYSTALLSNFPGPPEVGYFIADGGRTQVLDMNFAAGLGSGTVGLGFLMMSYAGGIRVIAQADPSILSSDSTVDLLNEKILEELELLNDYDCEAV